MANKTMADLVNEAFYTGDEATFDSNGVTYEFTPTGLLSFVRSSNILGKSAVAVPLTGTTAETILATVNIPALGPNSGLKITSMWTYAGASANARSPRIRSGGLSGTQILTTSSTVNGQLYDPDRLIINRNSTSSQIMKNNASAAIGNQAFGPNFPTINLGVATTLDFTGQLVTGTDTLTLEAYIVELIV